MNVVQPQMHKAPPHVGCSITVAEGTDLLAAPVAGCLIFHEHSWVLHSDVICSRPGINICISLEYLSSTHTG